MAATNSSLTTYAALLKTRYEDSSRIANLTEADNVTLGLLRKNEGFSGDSLKIPIIYSNPQGTGGDNLAEIAGYATNLKSAAFSLTVGEYGGVVYLGEKVLRASKDNPGAFLANKTAEMDGLFSQMADDMSLYIHGNGGLALGRVSSVSGEVATLTEASDAVNFQVGMTCYGSATDGTSGSLYAGSNTVEGVDREAGTVTFEDASDINTGTGLAANDYLFRGKTFGAATNGLVIKGFGAFIASSASSIPSLFSLTRSVDPVRLGGCRVPTSELTGKGIEERLQFLGVYMTGRYGSKMPDTVILHPEDWQKLAISLQARGTRPANDDSAKFGYRYLEIIAGGGLCKVYADRHCPNGTAWMLRMDTWTLWSMGKLFDTVSEDGNVLLRTAASGVTSEVGTVYEFRTISFPGLVTNAPGYNGRVAV